MEGRYPDAGTQLGAGAAQLSLHRRHVRRVDNRAYVAAAAMPAPQTSTKILKRRRLAFGHTPPGRALVRRERNCH